MELKDKEVLFLENLPLKITAVKLLKMEALVKLSLVCSYPNFIEKLLNLIIKKL